MTRAAAVAALARTDARTVARDPLLAPLAAVPPVLVTLLRLGLPPLAGWLQRRVGVDLAPYAPLLAAGLVVVTIPAMFGAVAGVLLLEERDSGTLTALRVTPLGLSGYTAWRVGSALALGAAGVAVGVALSGLVEVARLPAAAVLVPASLVAPVTALLLVAFSDDKIAAMAVAKGANVLLTLPLAAWFVDGPWQLAFGVLPTYWPVKALWEAAAGRSPWPYAVVGTVHLLVLGAWLARRFALRLGRPS